MDALIFKPVWAERVAAGIKPWEIRSKDTAKRGPFAIAASGEHLLLGIADLTDTLPLTEDRFNRNWSKHLIACTYEQLPSHYKRGYVWKLGHVLRFKEPIPYIPKPGCVIWMTDVESCLPSYKDKKMFEIYVRQHEKQKGCRI